MRNRYILFRENANQYVLQRDFPHIIGKLSNKKEEDKEQSIIPGYNLYLVFDGVLRGNYATSDKFFLQETSTILPDMASFLLENLISNSQEYEKYKIRNTDKQHNSQSQD